MQRTLLGWLITFTAALVLYACTANRGAQWQDSGSHILRIYTGELNNPLGLALSHPLHFWFGRFAIRLSNIEPAFAITLVSSVAGALAVANVFGCVMTLTRCLSAAAFAAASLAVAHTFWQMSTIAECYTPTAALLAGECWSLCCFAKTRRPGFLLLSLFLNGLGVSNHMQAALTTPVLAVVVLLSLRARNLSGGALFAGAALWIVGALAYIGMIALEVNRSRNVVLTMQSSLFGLHYSQDVLNLRPSLRTVTIGAAFILYNFPNLLLSVAAYGIARAKAASVSAAARGYLLAALVIHLAFVLRYPVVDQYTFLLPVYVLLAVYGGVGWHQLWSLAGPRSRFLLTSLAVALLIATPCVYAIAPGLARHSGVLRSMERHKPYRDDYVYFLTPWSMTKRSADRMSREALELAGPDGLIVYEDPMGEFAIRYRVLLARATNVEVERLSADETPLRRALDERRPVVLVPRDVDQVAFPQIQTRWRRVGDLYVAEH